MSYPRHHTIDHYLKKVRQHTEPYVAEVLGKEIVIYPNVMSPMYDRSSRIFIQMLPDQHGKSFLEMGSGTGIVSVFAALQGARSVTAADISKVAVENTRENFARHGILNAQALESDLFSDVNGTFDTIFFNAPFHGNKPEDLLELGTSDEGYAMLKRFMAGVPNFMNKDGLMHLGFSDTGDSGVIFAAALESGLQLASTQTQENGDWTAILYTFSRL